MPSEQIQRIQINDCLKKQGGYAVYITEHVNESEEHQNVDFPFFQRILGN
jgi:hypothetical protein